jgi:hypothetical protein
LDAPLRTLVNAPTGLSGAWQSMEMPGRESTQVCLCNKYARETVLPPCTQCAPWNFRVLCTPTRNQRLDVQQLGHEQVRPTDGNNNMRMRIHERLRAPAKSTLRSIESMRCKSHRNDLFQCFSLVIRNHEVLMKDPLIFGRAIVSGRLLLTSDVTRINTDTTFLRVIHNSK